MINSWIKWLKQMERSRSGVFILRGLARRGIIYCKLSWNVPCGLLWIWGIAWGWYFRPVFILKEAEGNPPDISLKTYRYCVGRDWNRFPEARIAKCYTGFFGSDSNARYCWKELDRLGLWIPDSGWTFLYIPIYYSCWTDLCLCSLSNGKVNLWWVC